MMDWNHPYTIRYNSPNRFAELCGFDGNWDPWTNHQRPADDGCRWWRQVMMTMSKVRRVLHNAQVWEEEQLTGFCTTPLTAKILQNQYCTEDIVHWILYNKYCTFDISHRILQDIVHQILHTRYCTLNSVCKILHTEYCTQNIAHKIFYASYCTPNIAY